MIQAAAIQMESALGEVDLNLERAERLVDEAASRGAEWIVLPEFFTTSMALSDRLAGSARPLDGEPTRLLCDLAGRHGVTVGGSFLAVHPDGAVRNTFVLANQDGVLGTHDKDLPTMWENCWYEPGADDGVIDTPLGPVGAAVCWELIRTQTVARLGGRVRMVVAGSCWWDVPENLPGRPVWRLFHEQNLRLSGSAVPTFARLLGVPVIHANWCGPIEGRWALGTRYVSHLVQEATIADAAGRMLARRGADEGAGLAMAEVDPAGPRPAAPLPRSFWIHPLNRTPQWRMFWWMQNVHGRRFRHRRGTARGTPSGPLELAGPRAHEAEREPV